MNDDLLKEAIKELNYFKEGLSYIINDLLDFRKEIEDEINLDDLIFGHNLNVSINDLLGLEKSLREYLTALERL